MNLDNIIIKGIGKGVDIKNKTYSIEEVYEAVKDQLFAATTKSKKSKNKKGSYLVKSPQRVMLDGDMIKANSQRLQLFYTKGFKCVICGTEGKFFVKCKNSYDKHYHLELVGVTTEGEYVLMTKDHIIPKSKGGKDELENYQTMCCICNGAKGDSVDEYVKGNIEGLKQTNEFLYKENRELKDAIIKLKEKLKKYEDEQR